ncbi:MAG TPA: hypothetical protein VK083_21580 [Nocardia sp.]|uniref:hypothetical protein n=1 Tax=Nocardia sp. TaxID=1821 RepID=UPI002B4B7D0E|nr:hypothetical protein [Nocardia sp.]HLS79380.1 hypothetical protein [Nocardia sp.]
MRRSVKAELTILAAILVAVALYYLPRVHDLVYPDHPADQGSRGLVVITTDGGDRRYTLYVNQYVPAADPDSDDPVAIRFYFRADDVDYAQKGSVAPLEFAITFAGFDDVEEEIRCGDDEALAERTIETVLPGARRAIEIDLQGGASSALAYGETTGGQQESEQQEEQGAQADDARYRDHRGTIWPYDTDADVAGKRHVQTSGGNSFVFVEECTVPSRFFWRTGSSGQFTLLPAQVDWTASTQAKNQYRMMSRVYIPRTDNVVLAESYPQARVYDARWVAGGQYAAWTSATKAATGRVAYSDQPVLIFENRGAEERQAIFLLWAGLLIGVGSTILLRVITLALETFLDPPSPPTP